MNKTLPKLKDGHGSNEYRHFPMGLDDKNEIIWESQAISCGEWHNGHQVLCDDHEKMYTEMYPQGWAYYPGDVCPHGKYVGGSGRDIICGACEMGE